LGEAFAGVKWMGALAATTRRQSDLSHRRPWHFANTPMEALSWGLFFRAAKKIAILTRRLF